MRKNKSNWFQRLTVAVISLGVLGFSATAPSAAFAANGVRSHPISNFSNFRANGV